MYETPTIPLDLLIESVTQLSQTKHINEVQRRFIKNIEVEASNLRSTLHALANPSSAEEYAKLGFDSRSQLSNIIGYSEILLDEAEGDLSNRQRDLVHAIRSGGKQLLVYITGVLHLED